MSRDSLTSRSNLMPLMPGDVRDYLLENPDFLEAHSDLLTVLLPPQKQHGDKVQDFQQFMLLRLQDHYNAIKDEHEDLMTLMQEHMQRQNRFDDAVLAMLDAGSFGAFLEFIDTGLALELDQIAVRLMMEAGGMFEEGMFSGLHIVPNGFVDRWLGDRDVELAEQIEPAAELFGAKAPDVRSRAMLRLEIHKGFPPGLLALGHAEPMHYSTGLATEQVEFLGAVIERCFQKWIEVG